MPWIALGYPLLAHLGVWLHDLRLQCLALIWLLAVALWRPLLQRRKWAFGLLTIGAIALCALTFNGRGLYVLYAPPILIPFALLILFAGSLRHGEVPLISRLAETMRGEPLPPALQSYTRNVTVLWCGISAALVLSAIATAIWARPEIWSLVTNVLHYAILGVVFLLEFVYRRLKYGHLERGGFAQYLRRLAHMKLRS